jgi:MFS family permease
MMQVMKNGPESRAAWIRLAVAVWVMTVGTVGMWSVVVALPAVQAEFGASRGDASLPYTLALVGFAVGGVFMGRLADRRGIALPLTIGALCLSAGYLAAGFAQNLWQFALLHGVMIGGLGSSAAFGPLIAEMSHWFTRRRGIAVAIVASGNYFAGTVWPPVVQHFTDAVGWRMTHVGIGLFVLVGMLPFVALLRGRAPGLAHDADGATPATAQASDRPLGFSPGTLQALLACAGLACCVAMAMPQVHIVAYCTDLGYGAARGAEMLSLMLGFGIVSRLASGWIADRIGGLRTLLVGSVLQAIALALFIPFDSLASLYVISALFGLVQGGIVPAYAIIIREYFSPREAGARVGAVLLMTLGGMALGGWMTGAIFDWTGSYDAAFLNGIAWNVLNIAIALWLLHRASRQRAYNVAPDAPTAT